MSTEEKTSDDARWVAVLQHAHEAAEEARQDWADDTTDGYTKTSLPIVEAECAWVSTGLIWTGYSAQDQRQIVDHIAYGVVAALLLRGWTPSADDSSVIAESLEVSK